jgi:hypothetical protein
MKEKHVSFETARLAKEKGFDVECNSIYFLPHPQVAKKVGVKENVWLPINNTSLLLGGIPRPTQGLLQKWLREEHNISAEARVINWHHIKEHKYTPFIIGITPRNLEEMHASCGTYEKALEIALQAALKYVNENY